MIRLEYVVAKKEDLERRFFLLETARNFAECPIMKKIWEIKRDAILEKLIGIKTYYANYLDDGEVVRLV